MVVPIVSLTLLLCVTQQSACIKLQSVSKKVDKIISICSMFPQNVTRQILLQETQLSLTNRATRLEVSQSHQTKYHSIC